MAKDDYNEEEFDLYDFMAIDLLLNNILDKEEADEYRDELSKENPSLYKEYLKYEK